MYSVNTMNVRSKTCLVHFWTLFKCLIRFKKTAAGGSGSMCPQLRGGLISMDAGDHVSTCSWGLTASFFCDHTCRKRTQIFIKQACEHTTTLLVSLADTGAAALSWRGWEVSSFLSISYLKSPWRITNGLTGAELHLVSERFLNACQTPAAAVSDIHTSQRVRIRGQGFPGYRVWHPAAHPPPRKDGVPSRGRKL